MDNRIVDLHVHSTESDGTFTPTEVIAEAKNAGLSAIALTDHDTATGIRKAMGAAKEAGIELIPGIELSTAYTFPGKKQEKEIHIVGLYINPDDPELLKMTAEFRECRDKRNEKMIAALQEEGFPITMEALLAEKTSAEVVIVVCWGTTFVIARWIARCFALIAARHGCNCDRAVGNFGNHSGYRVFI